MKFDKQFVISKTKTFIYVVLFVVLFKSIFGEENTLVGVTTVTAALMFLERDLTLNPIKNFFKFAGVNLLIGVGASLASSNMYLGILVNFVVLFIISYLYCYNLRNPLYLAFSLQYLFLLATPVAGDKILLRMTSLIVGAMVIVALQFFFNRNRLTKYGPSILGNVCDLMMGKLNNVDNNMDDASINSAISASIDSLRTMIYDKRDSNYYLTEEGRLQLNLTVSLESVNGMLSEENIHKIDEDILATLKSLITDTKFIIDISSRNRNENFAYDYMNDLLKICEEKNINDLLNLQLLDSMLLLSDSLDDLRKLDVKDFDSVIKKHDVTEMFSDETIKSFLSDKKTLKFCYAMRVAITITIGAFIMDYYKLSEGRWIIFTILSLINPLYEVSKTKSKDRVLSTLVGSLIVCFLFNIFTDTTSRTIIVMLAGYIGGFFSEYKYTMITTTVSAIGSAALVGNVQVLTLNRIFFVIVGAIMAIVANNFIFPYSVQDSITHLKKLYHATVISMLEEINILIDGEKRPMHMKNLLVLTSLIDARARTNASITSDKVYNEVITERRNLIANIYELYQVILKKEISCDSQKDLLSNLKNFIDYDDSDMNLKINNIKLAIKDASNIDIKIILSSITVILKELSHLNELDKETA